MEDDDVQEEMKFQKRREERLKRSEYKMSDEYRESEEYKKDNEDMRKRINERLKEIGVERRLEEGDI